MENEGEGKIKEIEISDHQLQRRRERIRRTINENN